jgi:aspartyl aminopeptidase
MKCKVLLYSSKSIHVLIASPVVVLPEIALHLEDSSIKATGTLQATATLILLVKVKCNKLQSHVEEPKFSCVCMLDATLRTLTSA